MAERTLHLGATFTKCAFLARRHIWKRPKIGWSRKDSSCCTFVNLESFAIERKALAHARPKRKSHAGRSSPLSHLSAILLVSLLVLSPHVLWAQRTSTLEDAPSNFLMPHHGSQRLRNPKQIFISPTQDYP